MTRTTRSGMFSPAINAAVTNDCMPSCAELACSVVRNPHPALPAFSNSNASSPSVSPTTKSCGANCNDRRTNDLIVWPPASGDQRPPGRCAASSSRISWTIRVIVVAGVTRSSAAAIVDLPLPGPPVTSTPVDAR